MKRFKMPRGIYKRELNIHIGRKNPFYGKKHTKKTQEKMRNHHKGMLGKKHTEKTKVKMKKNNWAKKNPREKSSNWKGGIYTDKKKYYREYLKKHPELQKKRIIWTINYRAKKRQAEGSHTLGEWELLKKQYGYTCPSCKRKEPEIKLTEDHIIPLSKGGSNWIENIQPLCRSCNSRKNSKIVFYPKEKEEKKEPF